MVPAARRQREPDPFSRTRRDSRARSAGEGAFSRRELPWVRNDIHCCRHEFARICGVAVQGTWKVGPPSAQAVTSLGEMPPAPLGSDR